MNKFIYASLFLFLTACAGNSEKAEKQEAETEVVAEAKYACPMKCEGEKTYAAVGTCPVCKMDLQEIAMAETDSTGHAH